MKILIAAGGSGGHLLPAQQLAKALAKEAEVLFAGSGLKETPFFQRERFAFYSIASGPLPKGIFRIAKGVLQSLRLILREKPDLIIGFGSYHSVPVLAAAVLLRRKIALFEANCIPGKVIRLFRPAAALFASQFPLELDFSTFDTPLSGRGFSIPKSRHQKLKSRVEKSQLVPLLPWDALPSLPEKRSARVSFGLDPDRKTLLVFGGSQGAKFLNETIPEICPQDIQVIHLTGEPPQKTFERYESSGILASVKAFETDMPTAYAAADFAICRSGAGTMAELIRFNLPALLIPFPFAADDHQRINAEFLAKKIKGAKMILQGNAGLKDRLAELLEEGESLKKQLKAFSSECEGRKSFQEQIRDLL